MKYKSIPTTLFACLLGGLSFFTPSLYADDEDIVENPSSNKPHEGNPTDPNREEVVNAGGPSHNGRGDDNPGAGSIQIVQDQVVQDIERLLTTLRQSPLPPCPGPQLPLKEKKCWKAVATLSGYSKHNFNGKRSTLNALSLKHKSSAF